MDYALEMLREQRDSDSKARAQNIVARVHALDVRQYENGTMVRFTKLFSGEKPYTYVALKANDRWYVSDQAPGYTDEMFEDLLAAKLGFGDFELLEVVKPKAATIARQSRVRR